MKTPILETERLVLRPISMADAPAIQKYFNNWNIIKNLSKAVPWPYPDDGAETFVREYAFPKINSGKAHIWVITLKGGDGEAIGIVDYHDQSLLGSDGGNRGNWLAEPFHGNGYMTEAVTAMQDFLFFDLRLERLTVVNAKINESSRRVQQKTGSVPTGTVQIEHHSGAVESEMWELTRERWAKIRGRELGGVPSSNPEPL